MGFFGMLFSGVYVLGLALMIIYYFKSNRG
jgi:hypothetical protein